jgi:AraC-like DNA-binding protein
MDRQGGSIMRVLSDVDLPYALLERRELVVPLREQFRLLERAARETGDAFFGARLGQAVKSRELSAFGAWVCAAETLAEAIGRAHLGLNTMLQTSTILTFSQHGEKARWSIEFVEPETTGRHHNEFLGLGYMIDVVRNYAGPRWRPHVVMTALPRGTPAKTLEDIFLTNVSHGHAVPAIELDAALLGRRHFDRARSVAELDLGEEPPVPEQNDALATIAAVTELALCEGYPRIDWVASKLGTTRRSLQRRLNMHGATFNGLVEMVLMRQAKDLLCRSGARVTDIALQLGYADPAHFSRAFRRSTGVSPSLFRQTRGSA